MEFANSRRNYLTFTLLGVSPLYFNGLVNSVIHTDPLLYWSFELLTWILIPALGIFLLTRIRGFSFGELGFHRRIFGLRSLPLLIVVSVVFAPACYRIYWHFVDWVSRAIPAGGFFHYETVIPESGALQLLVVVYFALTAGIFEEIFFRGALHRGLAGIKHATPLFLALSPLLFSLIHWENGLSALVTTWLFGLFMSLAYLLLRNIWPLIIGHSFTDLLWFS